MVDGETLQGLDASTDQLREVGVLFYQRNWSVGTSGNYSLVLQRDPLELLTTASHRDKGALKREDFVRVDGRGEPAGARQQPQASAEALLHVAIAQSRPEVGSVLHTHSVWATELSQLYFDTGGIQIEGYEMLKGLAGVQTHAYRFWLEIFDNTQDIPKLADQVRRRLLDTTDPVQHGFLIRRHGLYTWGRDVEQARRHVEILEFLLECVARRRMWARSMGVVEFPSAP
jgi:methylthioribulose-1-phosphate dehydratase